MKTEHELSPERRLWASVLMQALADHQANLMRPGIHPSQRFDYAKSERPYWWFTCNYRQVGSFQWICAILDIDADAFLLHINDRDIIKRMKVWNQGGKWNNELWCSEAEARKRSKSNA